MPESTRIADGIAPGITSENASTFAPKMQMKLLSFHQSYNLSFSLQNPQQIAEREHGLLVTPSKMFLRYEEFPYPNYRIQLFSDDHSYPAAEWLFSGDRSWTRVWKGRDKAPSSEPVDRSVPGWVADLFEEARAKFGLPEQPRIPRG